MRDDERRAARQDVIHELIASIRYDSAGRWWRQEGVRRGVIRPDGGLDRDKLSAWLEELIKARLA